jgi:hypothetical protein
VPVECNWLFKFVSTWLWSVVLWLILYSFVHSIIHSFWWHSVYIIPSSCTGKVHYKPQQTFSGDQTLELYRGNKSLHFPFYDTNKICRFVRPLPSTELVTVDERNGLASGRRPSKLRKPLWKFAPADMGHFVPELHNSHKFQILIQMLCT